MKQDELDLLNRYLTIIDTFNFDESLLTKIAGLG